MTEAPGWSPGHTGLSSLTEPLSGLMRFSDVNSGEAETAEDFCRRMHPRLVRSLALFCGDETVAEEVAQEALGRAWVRWSSVAQMARPEAWLFRVGLNLTTSRFRRRGAERRALNRAAAARGNAAQDLDVAIVVRQAVSSLPPRERAAVVLRFFVGLSVDDAAAAMRCRPGTVKSLTHHAKEHLRVELADLYSHQEVQSDA